MAAETAASEQIARVLETKIHSGRRPEVESLIEETISATREDPKAINYEFFMDGDVLRAFEKYADSPATLAHLAWLGENIAERFLSKADITRFTVYGSPSDEVREIPLDGRDLPGGGRRLRPLRCADPERSRPRSCRVVASASVIGAAAACSGGQLTLPRPAPPRGRDLTGRRP